MENMFEKILLPLDGSEIAESAIPYVRELAARLGAEVYLLHVFPASREPYHHMHEIYLEHISELMQAGVQPLDIQVDARAGEPTKAILDYAQEKGITLVTLTTYSPKAAQAQEMGNVSEKVIRSAGVPVFLIRVKEGQEPHEGNRLIQRILLPLDGSDASKEAVNYAVNMAKKMDAEIILYSMAETIYARGMDNLVPGAGVNWDKIDAATVKQVSNYLEEIENKIKQEGVNASHVVTLSVDAAHEILEQEKKANADLVVMATRGRSHIARWAFGSVAEKVLRGGSLPLLVVKQKTS
jgi:nucleotide-binding universal stress UspA family protein